MIAVVSISAIGRNSPRATPRRSVLANRSRPRSSKVGAVEARDVGKVAGLGQDQLDHAAQRALGESAELGDQSAQQVFGRAFEAVDELVRLHQRLADRFGDHRLEELFLVLEVEVGEALADAGGFGDVLELGGGEARGDEQVERRAGDLRGAVVRPAGPSAAREFDEY